MIGDTTHDLQMARNAGCASLGVSYGAHAPVLLMPWAPAAVAPSVADLHDWLVHEAWVSPVARCAGTQGHHQRGCGVPVLCAVELAERIG